MSTARLMMRRTAVALALAAVCASSDAPWLNAQMTPSTGENHYVTDGPELRRSKTGDLLMLVVHQPFQNARS